ncbi:MAG: DUF1329 domain-containing protein [Salinisphaeraceae bacterium]|nr:DUF1329 domain-containing protein [Salinisphaeraceae bacterium]
MTRLSWALIVSLGLLITGVARGESKDAAELGGEQYTCFGAEKAGSELGVAAYTGQWFKTWPGMQSKHGYVPGPYADEQPLFKITAANYKQYEQHLTAGMQQMFVEYPESFYMNIYPSHRDFRVDDDIVCPIAKENARTAKLTDAGLGVDALLGGPLFPFPENGAEAVWNSMFAYRPWSEDVVYDTADVYPNGNVAWGKVDFMTYAPAGPKVQSGKKLRTAEADVAAYFFYKTILPARSANEVAVGYQPLNFSKESTQAWQYQPGLRRVRKAPEVGFDYPVPPAGLRTSDDDSGFNGSPERYNWRLIGKKEIYVPYNNFKINDPALSYKDLTTIHTINPEYIRYELHRVWLIEGTLKEGHRHIYKKRILYADEDGWRTLVADAWDNQDELFRVTMIHWFYSQEAGAFHRGVSVYHDLSSGAYEATYLVNEAGDDWWRLNVPMRKQNFSPDAAARAGQ